MQYILIQTQSGDVLYQEVERGVAVRYCDMDGNTLPFPQESAWVINATPPPPSWALPDTPIPPTTALRTLTRLAFRNRFTMDEKSAIYTIANTNVAIQIWLDDLACSEFVDLDSMQTQQAVSFLFQAGLLTEIRKNEILNA